MITFGKSKKSDIHIIKIKKYGVIKEIIIRVKNEIFKLKVKKQII